MFKRFTTSSILLFLISLSPLLAQKSAFLSGLKAEAELGTVVSSNESTPFWLSTNKFGIIPTHAPAGILQAGIRKPYMFFDSTRNKPRKLDWSASFNPVVTYEKTNKDKILLAEAFASVRFKTIELYLGSRKEVMGLGDTTLTSGFYTGSGNALPIPKIQIGTIGFTPLKFTKNFVAVHAGFSHGWFATDYMDGVRLHQKFFYFRLGKPASRSKFFLGLNHNVLWAGRSENLKDQPDLAIDGKLPSSWKLFPHVVFATAPKSLADKNSVSAFDDYRLGNHLGSYDIGFETILGSSKIFVYHQHPFEDVSSMVFQNLPDGLYGINVKIKTPDHQRIALTNITAEFLSTVDQSGETFYIPGSKFQGADNYFNHTQYEQCWSYRGKTIGTPFIIPNKDLDQSKFANPRYFPNNRVNMWYLGAQGFAGKHMLLNVKASFSRNLGTPGTNFDPIKNQISLLASCQYELPFLKRTNVIATLASDQGELLTNRTGGYIGIRKSW